ncbi:NUDIX hydrolase [archaeon]|jgi:8-oxo-dGTP diphosphatase|nr:NUDIX hydrolase [archaeon]MBT3577253.1 NUDIX hydrolase [archaeon]MBT6820505.1 NUDIX hydrolase [archaeon]MBT6956181.1 NUDIX hydrolase [archaeon]MBT7025755.1 NUDIX hydrolase [archaeon]
MHEVEFINPAATVDVIVEDNLERILLIKRGGEEANGEWALPGGYLDCGKETLEHAACRELGEETCLIAKEKDLILLNNYSSPDRDPRGHVISHTYIASRYSGIAKPRDDAKEVEWFSLDEIPKLAFDHNDMVNDYLVWRKRNGR